MLHEVQFEFIMQLTIKIYKLFISPIHETQENNKKNIYMSILCDMNYICHSINVYVASEHNARLRLLIVLY